MSSKLRFFTFLLEQAPNAGTKEEMGFKSWREQPANHYFRKYFGFRRTFHLFTDRAVAAAELLRPSISRGFPAYS